MAVVKLSPRELAEKMRMIREGALTGAAATQALCTAQAIFEGGRKSLHAVGDSIKDAQNALSFGPSSDPSSKVGGSWGRWPITDGELESIFAALLTCDCYPPAAAGSISSFSTDDKLIALTRGLDALSRIVTQRKMSVKMTNAVGDSMWIGLSPGNGKDYARWE